MNIYLGPHKSFYLSAAPLAAIASRFIQAPKPFENGHPFRGAELLGLLLVSSTLLLIVGLRLLVTVSNSSSTKYSPGRPPSMESSSQTRREKWRASTKSS